MKAILCAQYMDPSDLKLEDIPKPTPKEDELLIKIRATAINDFDWSLVTGKPFVYRLLFGLTKPKIKIPGIELSGVVEAIGKNIRKFKVGDEIYGDISNDKWGSFAEYICVKEDTMCHKPTTMTFEQAAAISHASMLAWQGLIDVGDLKNGLKILINGAGGGMGTFGYQIARQFETEITGVDTGDKLKMMESLGFDHIIDYKKEDFTKNGNKYDLILDAKTTRSPGAYQRSLKPGGQYVTVGGSVKRMIQIVFSKVMGRKNIHIVGLKQNKDLAKINDLFEEGKVVPVIDGPYSMSEIPKLLAYFGAGKHTGKIVISM